jgi:hypothetical protein
MPRNPYATHYEGPTNLVQRFATCWAVLVTLPTQRMPVWVDTRTLSAADTPIDLYEGDA